MSIAIRTSAEMFVMLISLFLIIIFLVGFGMVSNVQTSGNERDVVEKVPKIVQLINPDLSLSCQKTGEDYAYKIHAQGGLVFKGVTGSETLIVIPSISLRGEKARTGEMLLRAGEVKPIEITFEIGSDSPPLKLRPVDKDFVCTDDKSSCEILNHQTLILKNFAFRVGMAQAELVPFIDIPKIDRPIGACRAYMEIQCPSENRVEWFSLQNEGKECKEQEDKDKCQKMLRMCSAEVSVELVGIRDSSSLAEKLKHRILDESTKCGDKIPRFNIHVSDVEPSKFQWQIGEDTIVSFWKKPEKKELEDCYSAGLGKTGCIDMSLGGYAITIPPEKYQACG